VPEPVMQAEGYSQQLSPAARETRKQFPIELFKKLVDITDELAENPEAHPERIQKLGRRGETLLYKHPNPPLEITYEIDKEARIINFFISPHPWCS
jgi:mRNA-degrading endonuclease RelE of RelBE toxin-antitoxin system